MSTVPCVPCKPTVQSVAVPGIEGEAGTNGSDGINGFGITAADFVVPGTVGDNVTIALDSTLWMVIGMNVIVGQGQGAVLADPGPATFRVVDIPSSTTVELEWLDYPGDVSGGATISQGAVVTASGAMPYVPNVTSTANNYTALPSDDVILVTADAKTVTLPTAVGIEGKRYTIKLKATGTSTVAADGAEDIDGNATYTIAAEEDYVTVVSDGSDWQIIGNGV